MSSSVVCLMGPTASGKSQLSYALCDALDFEIISVDSALVYRGMDIGSAKPEPDLLEKYPHHLINIRSPLETYSAAEFRDDALKLMAEIVARNKRPLLVGGTMLYFKALQQGLDNLPVADKAVREKIALEAERVGWEQMHQRLQGVDAKAAEKINPNDAQRIQRALEVYEVSGQPMSELWGRQKDSESPYNFLNLALYPEDRAELHQTIATRFEQMLAQGLVDEVRGLMAQGVGASQPAMRAVGYRQVCDYLCRQCDFETMKQKALAATRQLAKRQFTWLRAWPALKRFSPEDPKLFEAIVDAINDKF